MKIELKKISVHARLSEETNCFSADLYIDGKKRGEVLNDGQGGCHRFTDRAAEDELSAYAKTLPKRHAFGTDLDVSAEWLIDDIVEDHIMAKALKASMKHRVLIIKDGEVRETKKLTTAHMAQVAERFAKEGLVVLNLLPIDKAVETYKAHAK